MTVLPWQAGTTPLMLAPMQGLFAAPVSKRRKR